MKAAARRTCLGALALVAILNGCRGGPRGRPSGSAADPIFAEETPPLPAGVSDAAASVLTRRAEVDLTGPRVDAVAGDFVLRGKTRVAVVSREGALIDFGAPGEVDALTSITPVLLEGIEPVPMRTRRALVVGPGRRAIYVERDAIGLPLRLHAWWYLRGEELVLESMLTETSGLLVRGAATSRRVDLLSESALELANDRASLAEPTSAAAQRSNRLYALAEVFSWGNLPAFVGGTGFLSVAEVSYAGPFVAREEMGGGPAYAACAHERTTHLRLPYTDAPGFHANPLTRGPPLLPVKTLLQAGALMQRRMVSFASGRSIGHAAMSLSCPGAPRLGFGGVARLVLPPGAELAKLPAQTTLEVRRCGEGTLLLRFEVAAPIDLPRQCVEVRLAAPGHAPGPWTKPADFARRPLTRLAPKAGSLRFEISDAEKRPLPARVLFRGLGTTPDPDFGERGHEGGALSVLYLEPGPRVRALPPGRYHVTVSRGFEYTRTEEEVTVSAGAERVVRARLERVVDTRGWLSADLHLHAQPSPDAPTTLLDRIRSLAAVGVEVAVATDHNAVTDYAPAIASLGLGAHVASIVGDEVTTREVLFGHWNVFPLLPSTPPLVFRDTTPGAILAAARAALPLGAGTVVQLNHPRMKSLGYFDLLRFDPGDPRGWAEKTPHATLSFDAIEVFNGDYYNELGRVEASLADFFGLVSAGVRVTATGNSDSHKLVYQEAGVPRTYVAVSDDSPRAFDERMFITSLRGGRAIVSSGPFVELTVDGRAIGARLRATSTPSQIHVRVQAPPWVDVSEVTLVKNGKPWKKWHGPFPAKTVRLAETFREPLRRGDWLVAIARGQKPMTGFHRSPALPFAFTNPIYVD